MSIKRTICLVLSVVILSISALTMTINANIKPPASAQWYGTSSVNFALTKSTNGTGYITTNITGNATVTKIEATTQLYLIGVNGSLIKIGNSNYHTSNTTDLDEVDIYNSLPDGSYYATLSATVYSSKGTDYINTYDVN